MLVMNNKLDSLPVFSVQASGPIGRVTGYIIDPRKLSIPALYVNGSAGNSLILHSSDIREFNSRGLLIDHDEQLMEEEGLVRLQQVIGYKFHLVGKPVETDDGRKLGKVSSFAFDSLSWNILRLNVGQSLVRNVSASELIIHRQQIVKVTDDKVVVDSAKVKVGDKFSLKRFIFGQKPAFNTDTTTVKPD